MNNRREEYLDKVINYIVEDTIIDHGMKGSLTIPFHPLPLSFSFFRSLLLSPPFYSYCGDIYGLTDDEIEYVWDKYKNIINDKIINKPINESVDRKQDYLDSIIGYLVDDTLIDHENYSLHVPHLSTPLPFSFLFLRPLHFLRSSLSLPFTTYCKDTYGLTDDEIAYVWDRYRAIIHDKIINKGSINESVDRRSEYLDKVVDYLVEDTIVDHEARGIILHFLPSSLFPSSPFFLSFFSLLSILPFSLFSTYCKDTYGLTKKEIKYVWENYRNIINDKINNIRSINESNNILTRRDYLDKIVEYMVEDTEIDLNMERWSPPFQSEKDGYPAIPSFAIDDPHALEFPHFSYYCGDTYGLTDEDEINYVWDKYTDNLRAIFNMDNYGNINESVDRKKEFLDKVIDYFVNDTIIDHENNRIHFSFTHPYGLAINPLFIDNPTNSFYNYCIYNYSLTDDEINYVWDGYRNIMFGKLKNYITITESVDRKKDYLDTIIGYLVDDTKIETKVTAVTFPFSLPTYTYIPYRWFTWKAPLGIFLDYFMDTYGLTYDEADYVWDGYRKIIKDKINNIRSINESVDRRSEYLDKVLGYLMDDTEISNDEVDRSFKPPITPVWFHPSYLERGYDKGDLDRSFITYCRDAYGLTNSEIKGVWDKYKKNILNIFKSPINESVDRKDEYLNKIVDFMIDDTRYSINTDIISILYVDILFPMDPDGYPAEYNKDEIYEWANGDFWQLFEEEIDFICNTYSICDIDTIQELYNRYIQKLATIIYDEMLKLESNNNSIN